MRRWTLMLPLFVLACGETTGGDGGDGDDGDGGDGVEGGDIFEVDGHVQKGPFVNGTAVAVNELDTGLIATGRVFNTTIVDDAGTFSLPGVALDSDFARVSADGFYYNEVSGELSEARMELHMLADLSQVPSVNVNLIGHLERSRVEYLIGEGESFTDAKAQAQAEVLAIFEVEKPSIEASEALDISDGSDDGAILLAISAIVQGARSTGQVSELLSAMSTDLREDGTIDSVTTGSALLNAATVLDRAAVRSNIETRYDSLGTVVTVGDFESHIQNFIDSTDFEFTGGVKYPSSGSNGPNVLDPETTAYNVGAASMVAELPPGTSLQVTMQLTSGAGPWGISGDEGGWLVDDYDFTANEQHFRVVDGAEMPDLDMFLDSSAGGMGSPDGGAELLVYENGAMTPTWTKSITWAP